MIYGYDSVAKLSKEEIEAIPYVTLANQFVCVAWFTDKEKYKEILDTNIKMTTWMITHLEKLKL